jgi:hypothetical protein
MKKQPSLCSCVQPRWTTFGGMPLFSGSALASIKLIGDVLDYVHVFALGL